MAAVVVIGGGIAGVSVAAALANRGREVVLVEAEPQLGAQSTGRNAAIFRLAVAEPVNVRLALRSREIGQRVVPGGTVRAIGGLYPCSDDGLRGRILDAAGAAGVREARPEDRPGFLAEPRRPALFSEGDGVIDVHGLLHALAAEARAGGARFLLGARVDALDRSAGRCTGVVIDGRRVPADTVVDARGPFSDHPAVRPHRRHLFLLDAPAAREVDRVVWDLTESIYLRPESGGVLVSPCDETPMAGRAEVPTDPEATALLFEKLSRWAPSLAGATLRRSWAGLRPLTEDHRFLVGPDPLLAGLFRLGGFGGHGATAGAAAGELAAALICGESHPDAAALDPARFAR